MYLCHGVYCIDACSVQLLVQQLIRLSPQYVAMSQLGRLYSEGYARFHLVKASVSRGRTQPN